MSISNSDTITVSDALQRVIGWSSDKKSWELIQILQWARFYQKTKSRIRQVQVQLKRYQRFNIFFINKICKSPNMHRYLSISVLVDSKTKQ